MEVGLMEIVRSVNRSRIYDTSVQLIGPIELFIRGESPEETSRGKCPDTYKSYILHVNPTIGLLKMNFSERYCFQSQSPTQCSTVLKSASRGDHLLTLYILFLLLLVLYLLARQVKMSDVATTPPVVGLLLSAFYILPPSSSPASFIQAISIAPLQVN